MSNSKENHANPRWFALVNDRIVTMPDRRVFDTVLRSQSTVSNDHDLFRDHLSPDDPIIPAGEKIDLAEGNVFYSRPKIADCIRDKCAAPAKMALAVDDRFELTSIGELTVENILALFGLPQSVSLIRDFESPSDVLLVPGALVRFVDGPTFVTRGGNAPHHKLVQIKINKREFEVAAGKYTAAEIKKIGGVASGDELVQVIGHAPKPLRDDEVIVVCGGEVFISHPCRGTSS